MLGFLSLLLSGVREGTPAGWGVDNTCEDMMKTFTTFIPLIKNIDSMIGGGFYGINNRFRYNFSRFWRQF